jgi:hypothetical protein
MSISTFTRARLAGRLQRPGPIDPIQLSTPDDAGEVLGAVAMARNTTDRRAADRELRKRIGELEAALKARP